MHDTESLLKLLPGCEPTEYDSAADHEAWLRGRRFTLGASDIATAMGASGYKSAARLSLEKRGKSEPKPIPPGFSKWGHRLEPQILEVWAEENDLSPAYHNTRTVRCKREGLSFLTCTPDGLWPSETARAEDGSIVAPGGVELVQVKTKGTWDDWKNPEKGIPVEYQIQIQAELAVTGAEFHNLVWLDLIPREVHWVRIPRVDAFIQRMMLAVATFWECVQSGELPPVEATQDAYQALALAFPQVDEKTIELEDGDAYADELTSIREELKRLEDRERVIKSLVIRTLEDARIGLMPSGRYFSTPLIGETTVSCKHCGGELYTKAPQRQVRLQKPRKKRHQKPVATLQLAALESRGILAAQADESGEASPAEESEG